MPSQNSHQQASNIQSVAGVPVGRREQPDSVSALAEMLASATHSRESVVPVGGGSHLGIGNPPNGVSVLLSTAGLTRVLAYEPADMTFSVEAGATLESVQAVLAEHGQALPVEVADAAKATIGGILATAMYGPKRLGWGTLRDYLIGISVAYPDGSVAKAGGLVVKNVSGFDLMRMHHGALGTLGVILSANFKVLPMPRSERTVVANEVGDDELAAIRRAGLSWRGRPAAFEVSSSDGSSAVAIRVDGRERTTDILASELASRMTCVTSMLDPVASKRFWQDYVAEFDAGDRPGRWWIRSRLLPGQTLTAFTASRNALQELGLRSVEVSASPGLGFLDFRGSDGGDLGPALARIRDDLPRTSIVAASVEHRRGLDAWGESVDAMELMTRLKREFDPGSTLNPGRFVGGL
ncbi:MAG: FAD-binding oxidoreductase [Thermomicrobiales bacterium]